MADFFYLKYALCHGVGVHICVSVCAEAAGDVRAFVAIQE
jgi:Pyruvate/2-oxoacid:ferredoxin oxidoreductase delta subunit